MYARWRFVSVCCCLSAFWLRGFFFGYIPQAFLLEDKACLSVQLKAALMRSFADG
jgi:hypothetical protein